MPFSGAFANNKPPLGDHSRMWAFVCVVSLDTSVLKSPVESTKIESSPFEPDFSVNASFVESGEIEVAIISLENVRSSNTLPESDNLYNSVPKDAKIVARCIDFDGPLSIVCIGNFDDIVEK